MKTPSAQQCAQCGSALRANSRFCPNCRAPITVSASLLMPPAPASDAAIDRAARLQRFNRWFLDWPDPTDSIGERLVSFSLSQNYSVGQKAAKEISRHIYRYVFRKVQTDALSGVQMKVIDYLDYKYRLISKETPRRHITIVHETNRKTRTTILARFFPDKNNIYVAVDAYILGAFDWRRCLREIFFWPLALLCLGFVISLFILPRIIQDNSVSSLLLTFGVYFVFLSTFALRKKKFIGQIIRSYRREHNLFLSLRQTFHRPFYQHIFNEDDVLMFLKSTLGIVVNSIIIVFEQNGISVGSVIRYITNINNYNSIVGNGVINQTGIQFGGTGNTMLNNPDGRFR